MTENAAFTEKLRYFETNDRERILKALELASPSVSPDGAASILLELGLDADTIIASLILDSYRNGPSSSSLPLSVEEQYGSAISLLVHGVIKIDGLKTNNRTIQEAQNIRNMLFALTDDIRVFFIKLAEKLHSLRVLDSTSDSGRKTVARECLDIYAPLADRLGISWMKNEFEDLSLKFINPETYQQIKKIVAEKRNQRNQFLELMQETIKSETKAAGIDVMVESRAKHFYSVYMKMRKRGISAEKIYDLSGIRIICESIENCYTLLGIIHRLWKPLSGCFKDYIAMPKPNGYQSLHTTIMFDIDSEEEGKLLEIQIRTEQMHQIAEYGIASHWLYKKGSSRDMVLPEDISVVNKLKNWKHSDQRAGEISPAWLLDIKREILRNWIFVFTPQGKVIKLAAGATPIDFAYSIHTAVGEHCVGAKANGSIVPLSSQLKSTQVVEILTSQSAHPNINWLQLAKTSRARNKIRSWLEKNDEFYSTGKTEDAKKKPVPEPPAVPAVPDQKSPEHNRSAIQMVVQPQSSLFQVRIEDEKNLLIRFARCCNPVTGDPIIGYVSRGRGIIIHRENCNNLANNPEFDNRKIEAVWENADSLLIKRFMIEAKYSANLFSEIESAIRKRQGHLIEGRLEEDTSNRLIGSFTMQLMKADDLKLVMKNIRGIPGMIAIKTDN